MRIKSKITALLMVILMLFAQVPFTAFAADTDINANLLSPDTLPNGRVDESYSVTITYDYKSGDGFQSISWNITDGKLPPGLALYPKSGPTSQPWIEGTPTKAGIYTFTICGEYTKDNGAGELVTVAVKTYTLTILPDWPLEIVQSSLGHTYAGYEYNDNVYLTYSRSADEWKMEAAEGEIMPEGLKIDSATGDITWQEPVPGKYNLKITAIRKGKSVSKVLKLIVEPKGGCKHQNTTKTAGKAATCYENGLADTWYCNDCEYCFLDEECKNQTWRDVNTLYTKAFHSDEDDDKLCDKCGKQMPIFKKVTSESEITSCGMYLVVSKIGDKYYTFKIPEGDFEDSIGATEIEQNTDGTFSYPKANKGVMILETEFAAECGGLDAGKPRYSFGTTINGIPYGISGADGAYYLMLDEYSDNKYGYRMSFTDGTLAIASVYSEYWGDAGGDSGILTAFEGTKGDTTKRFFSWRTKESYESSGIYVSGEGKFFYDTLSAYPIELYKLTYVGETEGGQNYTLSDGQSMVTINTEFEVIGSVPSNKCSTVSGISDALDTSYVERVISGQTEITGDVSVETCADINVKSEDGSLGEYGSTSFNSLVYTIMPKIVIKGSDPDKSIEVEIEDEDFNGSQMTLTLCVGSMNPEQIIHHKTDKTDEIFYNKKSENLMPGQKTFSVDEGYEKGNFVTFTVDSFSDIEILAAANDPITEGNAMVPVPFTGQTPSFTAVSDDPSRYSVELLRWIDLENNMDITKTDLTNIQSPYYNYKFEAGKKYEVVVEFTAVDGCELSYNNNFTINGEKTWWRGNGLVRTYEFVPNTDTVADKNENKFTVTGYNIEGYTVILALYKKDAQGNSRLVETQNAVYENKPLSFTATETDFTSAKVMVWDKLTSLKPVTDVESVKLE